MQPSNCLFSKAISKALYFRYLVANSLGNLQSLILFKAHTKESYIKESIIQIIPVITRFMSRYAPSFLTKEYCIEVYGLHTISSN